MIKWQDDFIQWNDIEFFDFYKKFKPRLPSGYIWTPPITLENTAVAQQSYKLPNDSSVEIDPNGIVTAEMSAKFTTICELNIKKYVYLGLYFK